MLSGIPISCTQLNHFLLLFLVITGNLISLNSNLASLKDATCIYSVHSQNGSTFYKLGALVIACLGNLDLRNVSVSAWSSKTLFTISNTHARPKHNVYTTGFMHDSGFSGLALEIGTGGGVGIFAKSQSFSGGSNTWGGYVTLTYIAQDTTPLNNQTYIY